jgi:hypothetical protein
MARRRHGVHRRNIADVMARVPNVFLMCSQKYSISCRHIEGIAEVMACAPKVFLMCSQKYSLESFSTCHASHACYPQPTAFHVLVFVSDSFCFRMHNSSSEHNCMLIDAE